ncbi:NADPH-dependent FMN reductase [Actinomadura madurae]|uniref:NAD(P)H-dependent FMN reductase n=1 Tax=Actinomadura madurae TaxID=1993 RepID=A0A1I5GPA3_9ACTN|nr:NADPH-dependent FMN reductase [Actinomadura madurae]SFO37740.1 NAD(P)H-dependent FMN reductase [Actinomadura madurae]SPT51439.1 FMN-dependent NADPH-azoreductase [Actinomadura madurae]
MTLDIVALSGSLRRTSHNTGLLRALQAVAPPGVAVHLCDRLRALPLFDQDREREDVPAPVADLRRRIKEADGVVIATPEYNSAIPGVLMNALDWTSRPADDSSLRGKPVAILGASPSQFGTARGQTVLRQVLHRIQAPVVVQPEITVFRSHERFTPDGTLLPDEVTEDLMRRLLDELVRLIEATTRTAAAASA